MLGANLSLTIVRVVKHFLIIFSGKSYTVIPAKLCESVTKTLLKLDELLNQKYYAWTSVKVCLLR